MVGPIKKVRLEQNFYRDEVFRMESVEEPLAEGTARTKAGVGSVCSRNSMEEARVA